MQASQLKQQLQPLCIERVTHSPLEHEYFRHYGLDFENQFDTVKHCFGYIDSCHYKVSCHLYQQPNSQGTWFIMHGYFDHAGLMQHMIRFFLQQGYDVVTYDLPGHGLSTGRPATIPDFSIYSLILEDVLNYHKKHLVHPYHAFGQSTGCAIITDFLSERVAHNNPLPFEKVVLSAPLIRPCHWNIGRFQLYFVRLFLKQLPRKFTNNSRDLVFLKKTHNDPLTARILPTQWVSALDRWIKKIESKKINIPLSPLIIQGTKDTTVDANHNIPVLQKLYRDTKILWLKDARHHLPNELQETRETYIDWIAKQL
ncbi:hypothetical protein ACH42_03435 [Endozoicomonas sp. (ex Bugula neritina AB1)]|nr:hypothetical protein ACH42_03435 [Endozoicomonas sp. (ex Bugula neritina AB1)]